MLRAGASIPSAKQGEVIEGYADRLDLRAYCGRNCQWAGKGGGIQPSSEQFVRRGSADGE